MRLRPNQILPSQDFLKPNTVRFILECIAHDKNEDLPPTPIVRQDVSGRFIAIDGHNLIAVRAYRDEAIDVHVATTAHDGLTDTIEENRQRNADLLAKYDAVLELQQSVATKGIHSFLDLIERNAELFRGGNS